MSTSIGHRVPRRVRGTGILQHPARGVGTPTHRPKADPANGRARLPPQLPEAYRADGHLIVLGDSKTSQTARALQASDLLMQVADEKYPGLDRALVSFVWSPFAVEKNVIYIAATDDAGLNAGAQKVAELVK